MFDLHKYRGQSSVPLESHGMAQDSTGERQKGQRRGTHSISVRPRGARRDRTLYADPPPPLPPCRNLAQKCQTMGAEGALSKICLIY